MKGETARILRAWPAPVFSGLSPSPACLCRPCVTEDESRAAGTRAAASPKCVACTAFPLSLICPPWKKASWKPRFIDPAVFSRLLSLPPCTRASSSRSAGTERVSHIVLLHLHLSGSQDLSTAVEDLHPSHKMSPHSSSLKINLISTASTREKFF